jgi:hypothetical protein
MKNVEGKMKLEEKTRKTPFISNTYEMIFTINTLFSITKVQRKL